LKRRFARSVRIVDRQLSVLVSEEMRLLNTG
jgi:hypothetical protein